MKRLGQALRLLYINAILVRHGLDEIILAAPPFRSLRFLLYLLPWNWVRRRPREARSVRIRRALEDLGPIFVKFGQILSTRRDLLPEDIGDELSGLQDRVPPFPGSEARRIIERSLGRSVDELFESFDEEPLASASIAQVHSARLADGQEVAVKVVRPGIEAEIRRDVGLLYWIAALTERYLGLGRRLRPVDVVAQYETTILDELDLMREAASASQLRRNFEHSDLLYVPRVYWPYTRPDVMVMERITGIPVNDVEQLERHGFDLEKLASRGVEIFFTQLMRDNFFHADMHPGNIFVSPENPAFPSYIAVDFGIMGSLTPEDQRYLAENLLAFFNRDYLRVAELHVQSGWVPAGTRVNEFEAAIRSVCEPIFARPLKEISFGRLLMRLFRVAHRFHMEVQPQLLLLQKTLLKRRGPRAPALPGPRPVAEREAASRAVDGPSARRRGRMARAEAPGPTLERDPAHLALAGARGAPAGASRTLAGRDRVAGPRGGQARSAPRKPAHGAGGDRLGARRERGNLRGGRRSGSPPLGGASPRLGAGCSGRGDARGGMAGQGLSAVPRPSKVLRRRAAPRRGSAQTPVLPRMSRPLSRFRAS